MAATAWLLALSIPSVTAGDSDGTVLFRVELRGDVPADVSFLVFRDTRPAFDPRGPEIIEAGIYVCGPPENPYVLPGGTCRTGETYETGIALPIGTQLYYRFSYDDPPTANRALLDGTVTVSEETQTLFLVHDFSGASLLPDTSASAGLESMGVAVAGWTLIGVAAAFGAGRLGRVGRRSSAA